MAEPALLAPPLIALAQEGDAEARATLLRLLGPRLWGLCRRLDREPEDAFQDVCARLLGALPRFDPTGAAPISAWAVTLAHRALVDRHRRRSTRGEVLPMEDRAAPGPNAEELVARLQDSRRLEQALQGLPEDWRRVVWMHHGEGRGLDEIAQIEGLPVGTVKSRLHRARARLLLLLGGVR